MATNPVGVDFSSTDLATLTGLAALCPGKNGIAVYQARALYLMVTGRVYNAPADCGGGGLGRPGTQQKATIADASMNWDIDLYPNPNFESFSVISRTEKEILEVVINDISGRQVYRKQVQTSKFACVLDLPLLNGIYFVTIKNQANEKVTKKMVVAK